MFHGEVREAWEVLEKNLGHFWVGITANQSIGCLLEIYPMLANMSQSTSMGS